MIRRHQDENDFVEGVLDDIDLHLMLEPYPFQSLENPTAIHCEVQFIEEALHDIDLGEDPPFLPQDPVQDAIQVRSPRRNPGGHTRLQENEDVPALPSKVDTPRLQEPALLFEGQEMQAFKDLVKQRNFIEHIRHYNAQFNFTSIGTNEVKHSGSDPKTYSQLNRSGNLRQPSFAQIYMHTSGEQLQHRRNMFTAFSSRYTATIQRVMDLHNPLARTYATDKERLRRSEADGTSGGNLQIVLKTVGGAQTAANRQKAVMWFCKV
ncbi:hypothetical protein AaE_005272 [Aphanomyces astaci]|uniref:Helitron helicase-like domain-containing protein n=1 Tax=Aphanomyces astaci TaxID=112090 RepID=A0A6A5A2X8_APHAT|nr:hypothetical protein AaE_005272 [Aphanomyces astaci]